MPTPPKFAPIDLPELPVDSINRVLGTELDPGKGYLSPQAHRHVVEEHPADYPVCLANLESAIADPTFVGQAPNHSENFEMIRRLPSAGAGQRASMLVAVSLARDALGRYRVRSMYLIDEAELERKRQKGTVKPVPKRMAPPF